MAVADFGSLSRVQQNDPAEFYQGTAGLAYHHGKRKLPESALPWIAGLRHEKFRDFIRSDDVVVELGVGAGWNLLSLRCARRVGVDVADFLAEDLRREGIEFVHDVHQVATASADVVICHHMLEHVISPADTLAQIRRILRPGGLLLLYTPYEVERQWRQFRRNEPNHHLFAWNPQTLGALVEAVGLSVSDSRLGRYGYDRVAASYVTRIGGGERLFRLARSLLHLLKPSREVRVIARAARA